MISLDSIYENVIAEVAGIVISILISKFAPNLIKKEEIKNRKFDALNVAILLASISIFNLILNISFWNIPQLTTLFTILSFVFVILVPYIYNNQCPSCKKFIGAKKRIDSKIINKFTREYKYQPMKIWLYSNGNIWKKEPVGKEKTRIENWITKQEFYECNHCRYNWDSGHIDINLDEKSRPKPEVVKTNEKDSADNIDDIWK